MGRFVEGQMLSCHDTSLNGSRVALLSCGQFDPPSYAHLRMFERARDFLVRTMGCMVVEGIMSVTKDTCTARTSAKHRLRMVETALRRNCWICAGDYECSQSTPIRQIAVLRHYQKEISQKHDGPIRILYLCGSEVLDELVSPHFNKGAASWNNAEIKELLQRHGLIVLKRGRTHPSQTVYLTDILRQYQKNIYIIEDETFPNDLRCSRIRTALRRGESVKYCLDDDVIEYINRNNLYRESPSGGDDQGSSGIESARIRLASDSEETVESEDSTVVPQAPLRSSSEKIEGKYKTTVVNSMETFCRGTEYAVTVQKAAENHTMNQHTELVPAKEAVSATFDVSSEDLKSNMDNECIAASSEPPKTAFMMPSHNQFTSPAGSPISNSKLIRGCETISDCAISFLEEHTILRNRAESPAYDNATLDDLLAASTSWTEYLQKENERIERLRSGNHKESSARNDSFPRETAPANRAPCTDDYCKGKGKRKGLFFSKNRRLRVFEPTSDDETVTRICGADRIQQPQASPEILWRRISETGDKERRSEHPPSPRSSYCLRYSGTHKEKSKNASRNISFGVTKSAESLLHTSDPLQQTNGRVVQNVRTASEFDMILSQCKGAILTDDGVTLRFRRYKLASTPETTV